MLYDFMCSWPKHGPKLPCLLFVLVLSNLAAEGFGSSLSKKSKVCSSSTTISLKGPQAEMSRVPGFCRLRYDRDDP